MAISGGGRVCLNMDGDHAQQSYWVARFKWTKTDTVLNRMPRDCTDPPLVREGPRDVQSQSSHLVSNTMTKTKTRKATRKAVNNDVALIRKEIAQLRVAAGTLSRKVETSRKTPFSDAGEFVGGAIGSFLPFPGAAAIGRTAGRALGAGIGSIFGSGKYTVVGPTPKYNVLQSSSIQTPKFTSNGPSNIVCHREYIGDISGSSSFSNALYPINPGVVETFPWLASVAANYQEYRIHGMAFHFRADMTDFTNSGNPGFVVMATNYNADLPAYSSKQQMENSEYAVSVKPTQDLVHFIECDPAQSPYSVHYVRSGVVPAGQDLRLYDHGTFQFATVGNGGLTTPLGELWVTYCVEFLKPVLPLSLPSGQVDHFQRTNTTGTAICGDTAVAAPINEIGCVLTSSTITWPMGAIGDYLVEIIHYGTPATIGGITHAVTSAGVILQTWNSSSTNLVQVPTSGTSTGRVAYSSVVSYTVANQQMQLSFNAPTLPSSSNVDVVITNVGRTYA